MRSATIGIAAALVVAAGGAGAQQQTWRHGVIEAKSDAGIYLMITKGFAEKQGLKLEIAQFKNDVIALQAMLAGDLDSFDGGPGAAITAAARGADVKVIGCEWPGVPYGIFVRPNINSAQDMKGKTFAISLPGANPDVVARLFLKNANVSADDVHFANLGADLDRFKSVVAGVADATVVSNEYTPIAEKQGVKMLLRASEVVPNFIRTCLFSTGKDMTTRREAAVRFLAAEMTAFGYALGHRDEVIALTREITGAKADDPRPGFIFDDGVKTKAIDPTLGLPIDKLKWMADQLVAAGSLPGPYDVTKMVDAGAREQALARIHQ
jgi:NitT/TauT family transport system substrate-binding protein